MRDNMADNYKHQQEHEAGEEHADTISQVSENRTETSEKAKGQHRKASKATTKSASSKKAKGPNILVDVFDKEYELTIDASDTGRDVFEQVVVLLDLKEVWFFGLEFNDSKGIPTWLKLKKKVFSQEVGKARPVRLKLKPKFYPEDVEKELIDSVAKKLFLEHVKRGIVSGDLFVTVDSAVLLASFALQEQYGNYNAVMNPKGFLENQTVLPQKVMEQYEMPKHAWEEKIVILYKDHRGMTKDQATMEYLRISQDLEMFGVTYFKIKNKKNTTLWLGVDALGINVYEKANKLEPKLGFPWSEVKAISYRDKRFTIKPIDDKSPNFVFFVDRNRTNKEILILCMGNHELYIRRRKIDVAPSQRNSSARLTDINVISEEPEQSTSYDPYDERSSKGSPLRQSSPISHSPPAINGFNHDSDKEEDDTVFSHYESAELKPDDVSNQYENDDEFRVDEKETDFGMRGGSPSSSPSPPPEPEYATVMEKSSSFEERRSRIPSPEPDVSSNHDESSSDDDDNRDNRAPVQISNKTNMKLNSVYEQINTGDKPMPSLMEEMPDSPPVSNFGDTSFRISDTMEKSRGSRAYEALLERYKNGLIDTKPLAKRETYISENKDVFEKVKNLFEDLSVDPSKLSEEDKVLLSLKNEKMDKYDTLRRIRSGFAKDRVAIFESLM